MAASQSVVSATERTAMTINSVPCRIHGIPKIHRVSTKKSKKTPWQNPKKIKKTTTTKAETPVKKAAPPNIRRIHTPSTVATSNPNSPASSMNKQESATDTSPQDNKVQPRRQCAITSLPKVHKRFRAPAPAPPCMLDLPVQEISFVHSDQDESEIAKTLMFGEDEGFEGILNGSIHRDELEEADHFLRRNLANASPQSHTNCSMETELRRNREKLDASFPQQNSITFDIHNKSRGLNDLSFETTSSMAVNDRLHLNESPIRPNRQVVGEETIMDTSREVEMVRNSFFDNEEMVEKLQEQKAEIPKEISLVTLSPAVVDGSDFVSPMQRLRPHRKSLELKAEEERRVAMEKQKKVEATRKANIVKHLTAERKKQEAADRAKAKQQEEEAMLAEMIAQAKQQEVAAKKASAAVTSRYETQAKKKQAEKQKKTQPKGKKEFTSSPASTEKSATSRPASPQTPTGPFVPEWAKKSLRKTSPFKSPVESVKSTVSSSSSPNNKKVPEWANKQLRKSINTRASLPSSENVISDELSSWMGKRRRASEDFQLQKKETK